MFSITGFLLKECIHQGENSYIYRGERLADGLRVIVKTPAPSVAVIVDNAYIQHEYNLLLGINSPLVVKVYELRKLQVGYALVEEDFAGTSLAKLLDGQRLTVAKFLPIAIKLTEAIADLHRKKIIHRDIKPAHVIWNEQTNELKLIDFSFASSQGVISNDFVQFRRLEGTFTYMSPEQSGRMNRVIDYRTDLYSLGATLYELLLGRPPFLGKDMLALIHDHLARQPLAPSTLEPTVPVALSRLLLKLLAKNVEDRYQSAHGVRADLLAISAGVAKYAPAELDFVLAEEDYTGQLQISQKLYGRELELAQLQKLFERVKAGSRELAIIGGYAGVGKTALIAKLKKQSVIDESYFIEGKFDQYSHAKPYAAFSHAFNQLAEIVLSESLQRLQFWKEKILEAVGCNGAVLIEVVPKLELIIGKQPAVVNVGAQENMNRFIIVFQNFVKVFTRNDKVVICLIDDWQWADSASLELLKALLDDAEIEKLFMLGAYRDNEVDSSHPFIIALNDIRNVRQINIAELTLNNLCYADIAQLLTDTLARPADELADLLYAKTDGNPFFVIQLLNYFYENDDLYFDFASRSWQWSIEHIRTKELSDNVVELLAKNIAKLPLPVQELLQIAACIGNSFDIDTIRILLHYPLEELLDNLRSGLEKRLLLTSGSLEKYRYATVGQENFVLRFAHDRIQQAAYALLKDDRRREIHLTIARHLAERHRLQQINGISFEVMRHYSQAHTLLVEEFERRQVAEVCLLVFAQARQSAAYQAALEAVEFAAKLLTEFSWLRQYDLTKRVYIALHEAHFLTNDFVGADELFELLNRELRTIMEKVPAYLIKIRQDTMKGEIKQGVAVTMTILGALGVVVPKENLMAKTRELFLEVDVLLNNSDQEKALEQNSTADPVLSVIVEIASSVAATLFLYDPMLVFYLILYAIKITYAKGAYKGIGFPLSVLQLIYVAFENNYLKGYDYALRGLDFAERTSDMHDYYRVLHVLSIFGTHWQKRYSETVSCGRRAFQGLLEYGDLQCASHVFEGILGGLLADGATVEVFAKEVDRALFIHHKSGYKHVWLSHLGYRQLCRSLRGETVALGSFDDADFSEVAHLEQLQAVRNNSGICGYYIPKAMAAYLFGNYEECYECSKHAELTIHTVMGQSRVAIANFYYSLGLCRLAACADSECRRAYIEKITSNQQQARSWADGCPENFQHRVLLVDAELALLAGEVATAERKYEEAINLANTNEHIHEEAVAYECAARSYAERGLEKIAWLYYSEAALRYRQWGASAKALQLEQQQRLVAYRQPGNQGVNAAHSLVISGGADMDALSIIKASQTISNQINLEELLGELLQVMLENAGAEVGCLLISREDQLFVEARVLESGGIKVLEAIPLAEATIDNLLPAAVIEYVVRTLQPVIVEDGHLKKQFSWDAYFRKHQPRSLLALPIMNKNKLRGVIYLENGSVAGAFTPAHLAVLAVLATQAAISIDNASLYADLRRLYDELAQSEERYKGIFNNIQVGVFLSDMTGEIITVNKEICTLLEYTDESDLRRSVGNSATKLYKNQADRDKFVEILINDGVINNFEAEFYKKDGTIINASINASIMLNKAGEKIIQSTVIDITNKKEAEALNLKKAKAEAANQAKSEFLANMSHEIRTPLNAVVGMVYLLLQSEVNARQANYLKKIELSAKNLLMIINDILDFSKIEAGKMQLEQIEFKIDDVFNNLSIMAMARTEQKQQLEIIFDVDTEIPQLLIGDPLRLGQILINIVGNAIKFTDRGSIVVKLEIDKDEERAVTLKFTVTDTGIGMTAEQLKRMFSSFSQSDSTTSRRFGGSGLGLAICKKLVDMMDGSIEAHSEYGRGSEFIFRIPFSKANYAIGCEANLCSPADLHGMRVLVLDSNPVMKPILERYLKAFSFEVQSVASELEALTMLTQAAHDKPYKLVVIDYLTPNEDGFAIATHIRQNQQIATQPKIIMLTAHLNETISTPPTAAIDLDGLLVKPITISVLFNTIMECFGKEIDQFKLSLLSETFDVEGLEKIRGSKVLLVEDNDINQEVAAETLKLMGVNVYIASDGYEALEQIKTMDFELVLMDIQMPNLDGIETTKRVRKKKTASELPIVAMTAHAMLADVEKSLQAGMNDHLTKPIDPQLLFRALVKWIKPMTRDVIKPVAEQQAVVWCRLVDLENSRSINVADGLARLGGNKGLYCELIRKFYTSYVGGGATIRNALADNDVVSARRIAHTVRGVAGSIGATELQGAAARLELALEDEGAADAVKPLQDFETQLNILLSLFEKVLLPNTPEPTSAALGSLPELKALLIELEASVSLYKPKPCWAIMNKITAQRWSDAIAEKIAAIQVDLDAYDYAEAKSLITTVLKELEGL